MFVFVLAKQKGCALREQQVADLALHEKRDRALHQLVATACFALQDGRSRSTSWE